MTGEMVRATQESTSASGLNKPLSDLGLLFSDDSQDVSMLPCAWLVANDRELTPGLEGVTKNKVRAFRDIALWQRW